MHRHTHEANEVDEQMAGSIKELRAILINRCKTEVIKLKDIYEEEILR